MGIASLASPRAKLGRANEHLAAFDVEFHQFTEQSAKAVLVTHRHEGDWVVVEMAPIPDVPQRLALIAGDCLNNIRAALDHLVWQLVLREGKEPGRTHQFPFCETRQKFRSEVKFPPKKRRERSPLYGIPRDGDAWAIIEAAQPYQRPKPEADALSLVARLTNTDKHRTVLEQQTYLSPDSRMPRMFWRPDVEPIETVWKIALWSRFPLSTERPAELVRFRFPPDTDPGFGLAPETEAGVDVHGHFRLNPTVGDGEAQVTFPLLSAASWCVEQILEQVARLPQVQS